MPRASTVLIACTFLLGFTGELRCAELDELQSLLDQGQAAVALERLDPYIAQHPADAQARFLKGLALVELSRTADAIQVFSDLVRDHPDLPEPHNNLAVLYAAEGRYEEAREALQQALRTHPSYAIAHENLGDIYAKMAAAAYGKALDLDQGNQAAQGKLALVRQLFSAPARPPPVEEPRPVARPTPPAAAAAAAAAATAPRAEIQAMLKDWAAAWSRRDVQAYLDHYSPRFRPSGGLSRSAWEAQRRERLSTARRIEVGLGAVSVESIGTDQASVRFVQTYRSERYRDRVRKRLQLVRVEGHWRILAEQELR